MNVAITGTGWVTPLGRDIEEVWQAVKKDLRPPASTLEGSCAWPVWRVPADLVAAEQALPRLRRSSIISHFAVAAARDAVAAAGLSSEELRRCALVFVTSDGGVVYTHRFYADILKSGPATGSPLLFPETVYNAPASHVAASLGLAGEVLTLVGDSAAGLAAIHTACDLLAGGALDHCLVVASQELDWISSEAYGRWKLINGKEGSSFAEGAAAIVLSRKPAPTKISFSHAGFSYSTNREATARLKDILSSVPSGILPRWIISSGSGVKFDRIERNACGEFYPAAQVLTPKFSLGEGLAVSTLQQVIIAGLVLREESTPGSALVPAAGFNGQVGALILTQDGAASQDSSSFS